MNDIIKVELEDGRTRILRSYNFVSAQDIVVGEEKAIVEEALCDGNVISYAVKESATNLFKHLKRI